MRDNFETLSPYAESFVSENEKVQAWASDSTERYQHDADHIVEPFTEDL